MKEKRKNQNKECYSKARSTLFANLVTQYETNNEIIMDNWILLGKKLTMALSTTIAAECR